MTIDEIKKLIEVVRETGIGELEVQWGENRVRIRTGAPPNQEFVVPAVLPVPVTAPAILPTVSAPPPSPALTEVPPSSTPAAPAEQAPVLLVKSPIVGTYYDSPSPGMASFVKVGDRVELKQVLCIIESMKLMNEIEADAAGIIAAKHVENGRPVEYGELLFTLTPL